MVNAVDNRNFGYLISYLLPGFIGLWGMSHRSQTLAMWLAVSPASDSTVGGFLYMTVLSIGTGLTLSTVRWLLLDSLHHTTGIQRPQVDYRQLRGAPESYSILQAHHYDYYKFHGNTLMAVLFAGPVRWVSVGWNFGEVIPTAVLAGVFFLGSRDNLQKLYRRLGGLLAEGE